MSERALNFKTFVNESADKILIDIKALEEYSLGIAICCNGEYGDVYFNESQNHIFVCLGDSNPFDDSGLEEYIKEAVHSGDYTNAERIKVTIENEAHPPAEDGWQIFDRKKNKFVECK